MIRPEIDELEVFDAVYETRNFTRAAERLGLSKSMVSRRITSLESRLGMRFLSRSTHSVKPTELGAAFHERIRRVLRELDKAMSILNDEASQMSGTVRLSTPTTFGIRYLAPVLRDMLIRYPHLKVDVDFNDSFVDLVSEGFDFAIRIGNLRDSSMVARYIKPIKQVALCSPVYLEQHGAPTTPTDLLNHQCLVYSNMTPTPYWQFERGGELETIHPSVRMRTNSPEAAINLAVSGLGITVVPVFMANTNVEYGSLVPILTEYEIPDMGLYLILPPNPLLPTRVRTIVDHLVAKWRKKPFKVAKPPEQKPSLAQLTDNAIGDLESTALNIAPAISDLEQTGAAGNDVQTGAMDKEEVVVEPD